VAPEKEINMDLDNKLDSFLSGLTDDEQKKIFNIWKSRLFKEYNATSSLKGYHAKFAADTEDACKNKHLREKRKCCRCNNHYLKHEFVFQRDQNIWHEKCSSKEEKDELLASKNSYAYNNFLKQQRQKEEEADFTFQEFK
jgi:hypothetical protein